jgi:hypothetical protein
MDILIEEAEKIYNKLAKESIEKIIDEYSIKSSAATLPSVTAAERAIKLQ